MNSKLSHQLIFGLNLVLNSIGYSQCTTNSTIIVDSSFGGWKTLNKSAPQIEGQTYKWKPSNGLSCSECLKPYFLFSSDTVVNYTLTIYDKDLNCIRIDQFKVISKNEYRIVATDEESASFSGYKIFLENNLKYPEILIEDAISGKCYLTFIVRKTGRISHIKIRKGVPGCPECDKEAIRVIKLMPRWKPAKNEGKPVKSYCNLCIPFSID